MGFSDPREAWPRSEKPCIYRYSCGFDFCTVSDCEQYEAKTEDNEYHGRGDKNETVTDCHR